MSNVTPLPQTQIAIGSIVRLRSGGPSMTVRQIGGDIVIASWFNEIKELAEAKFSVRELDLLK